MLKDKLLRDIKSPADVKALTVEELEVLGDELRDCLIQNVSNTGGHLASNLGVVELTMALHRVFDSPRDQIVFDVGHQCYVHKLLTGRYEAFHLLRQEDGLSGFPCPEESEHDVLKTGHSSTAISSAVGLLKAFQLKGEEDRYVIAVVGDGAMTGGLSYEGLNNGGRMSGNLIVILNDNDMSISANVGSIASYLSKIRSKQWYFRFKDQLTRFTKGIPLVGNWFYKLFQKSKIALKSFFYKGNIFEDLGFTYLGPIDGHNQQALERVMQRAKELKRPCLIHVQTIKGKGYSYAENQPTDFHGLSSFDVETGAHGVKGKPDYSEVFGSALCELAEEHRDICAITAAMCPGCGLTEFSKRYPDRFFDVGIAEQHALTFAGGLAKNGMNPVFAVYSSFLQRGFDQLIHDLALQGVHATICVDRAGIVGEDGETHQGLFDIPMLMPIPGISIYSPTTYADLKAVLKKCVPAVNAGITAIRYPRGVEVDTVLPFREPDADVEWCGNSTDFCIVSYGRQAVACLHAIKKAKVSVSFLKLNRIYPLDQEVVERLKGFKKILFVEEGYQVNSIGAYLGNLLINSRYRGQYRNIGIKNQFVKPAKPDALLKELNLDADHIAEWICRFGAQDL